jgi:sporulation protein YlmC with PRC-barrel domain
MRALSSMMLTVAAGLAAISIATVRPAAAQSESEAHRMDHGQQMDQTQKTDAEPSIDRQQGAAAQPDVQVPEGLPTQSRQSEAIGDRTRQQLDLVLEGDKLIGKSIVGMDGKAIGEIKDVAVGEDGQLKAVVAEVGGFLGMGAKKVAVPITQMRRNGEHVMVTLSRQQVEALPEFKAPDGTGGRPQQNDPAREDSKAGPADRDRAK